MKVLGVHSLVVLTELLGCQEWAQSAKVTHQAVTKRACGLTRPYPLACRCSMLRGGGDGVSKRASEAAWLGVSLSVLGTWPIVLLCLACFSCLLLLSRASCGEAFVSEFYFLFYFLSFSPSLLNLVKIF